MIATVLAVRRRRPLLLLTIPFVITADVLAYGLKTAFDRPRPNLDPLVRVPTDLSFPSGHSATSFAGATMLALVAPRAAPILFALAVGVAFSRVYVGVHFPFDVLAGAAVGAAVGAVGFSLLRTLERRRPRSPREPPPG